MEKIVYRTIAEQVFEKLRQEILSGELLQGTDLKEESVSEKFGVSRGPIREAFKELTRYGLITPRGKAGFKVADPLTPEVRDLIVDIRRKIEIFVLKAVLPSILERDIKHLEMILERQYKACLENDVVNVRETDIRFHEFIIKKYKNNHVEETWRSGLNRMMMKYDRHASLLNNYEEHRRILDCIRVKDIEALVPAMEQNIQ